MVEVTSSAYISLDSTPSADTPPPGMLALILRPPPDRAPFFPLFLGMLGGEARETAKSDGIDPFALESSALLENVGEMKTMSPRVLTPSVCRTEKKFHVTFVMTIVSWKIYLCKFDIEYFLSFIPVTYVYVTNLTGISHKCHI